MVAQSGSGSSSTRQKSMRAHQGRKKREEDDAGTGIASRSRLDMDEKNKSKRSGRLRSKSKGKLTSSSAIKKVDSNATEIASNTTKTKKEELEGRKERNDHETAMGGDTSDKENASGQKISWVKKVSLSIGGYKNSFSDPLANLADAVNDVSDAFGNDGANLVQQAKVVNNVEAAPTEGEGEDAEEERDYDVDPSRLFMYLQHRQWSLALTQLQEHPEEARVWVYRKAKRQKEAPANGVSDEAPPCVRQQLRWKLLPLHAAIVLGAPTDIIQDIVRAYPNAAKKTDERGSLPVHLAASRLDVDPEGDRVVLQLFGLYPDSIEMYDQKGRTPPELAKLARARKDIEEQRLLNSSASQSSQVGIECTMSPDGQQLSADSADQEDQGDRDGGDDDDNDDDCSTGSGLSGRFRRMLRKSKSTDTLDRRKKKKKKEKGDKKSIKAAAGLSPAMSMDYGDDEEFIVDDKTIAESLGPGFAFIKTSKSQERREGSRSDEDTEEDGDEEKEPAALEYLEMVTVSVEYQTPENSPRDISGPMSIPLPRSDDGSVRSLKSKSRPRSPDEGNAPSMHKGREQSVTISEEPSQGYEIAHRGDAAKTGVAGATDESADQQPKSSQNMGVRVLLEKAVENAGRGGIDVTEFVKILEDEWVTDVEALRRLDGNTLDCLLPLMLSRELQRLINHADSIDKKFLKEDRQVTRRGRGRSPKKSSKKKKKKKKRSRGRQTKKRGHSRSQMPLAGSLALAPIEEE